MRDAKMNFATIISPHHFGWTISKAKTKSVRKSPTCVVYLIPKVFSEKKISHSERRVNSTFKTSAHKMGKKEIDRE